jgi:hydroxypyruvate isomerase
MHLAPNLSLLWADLPWRERLARAAGAGFTAVELWWPGDDVAAMLPDLVAAHGLRVALLNFDAGDMPAGDRGLAADPARREQLRRNVPVALRVAAETGCTRLNLLAGLRSPVLSPDEQLRVLTDNARWVADEAARSGCQVMVEAVNPVENGPYLFTTTAAAARFVARVERPNVRLQYDAYHMQRTEGNLLTTLDEVWPLLGHVQIADSPGRHEPGTGEINYRVVLGHLAARGYAGFVGLEYRPSTGRAEDSFGWIEEFGLSRGTPS